MKTSYLSTILFTVLFALSTCTSKESTPKNQTDSSRRKHDSLPALAFNFYPSSGESAVYTVALQKDTVLVRANDSHIVDSDTLFKRLLIESEQTEIEWVLSSILPDSNITANRIFDSWRIEFSCNNVVFYNKSGVRIRNLPPSIRKILSILIKDSSVKIDLYGFA